MPTLSEIAQKSQKIASAIYLITGFFADQEPLKWRLRTLATDLSSEMVKDKSSLVRDISNMFAVAKNASLVSDMNHEIISRELNKFEKEVENPLDKMFFKEPEPVEKALPEPVRFEPIKDKMIESVSSRTPERAALKDFGAVSVKKTSRQSIIINLLKRKKEIMIKDLTALIDDCSEKTIQRELLTMVSEGILKKIGEKRWSRYSLA